MEKLKPVFFLVIFSACALLAQAQKQNNIWYFGWNAGIDFSSGTPVAITSSMQTGEGTAVQCDTAGKLLFYTDGTTVWDGAHNAMPNGTGLYGGATGSSTQAALIVPLPGSTTLYYIFTLEEMKESQGFNYSIVDMSLHGGLGDITTKNHQVLTPTCEQIAAIKIADGTGYWIVVHGFNNATFYAYPFTASGVGTPVTTTIGLARSGGYWAGQMRFCCVTNKLATIAESDNAIGLFDFDPATGKLSNAIELHNGMSSDISDAYGLAFSPGGNFLYCSNANVPGTVRQFDLSSNNQATIDASLQEVFTTNTNGIGQIQRGPDNKLYLTDWGQHFLSVINAPDSAGSNCHFVYQAVPLLQNTQGDGGLPNFPDCLYEQPVNLPFPIASFNADAPICAGTCIRFNNRSLNASTYQWSFPGGDDVTSTDSTPTVCYSSAGQYDVQLIAFNSRHVSDTLLLSKYIIVNPLPDIGTVTSSRDSICLGIGLTSLLYAAGATGNIQWQSSVNGNDFTDISSANSSTYTTPVTLQQTTSYRITSSNSCGSDTSNTVIVHILPFPVAFYSYTINDKFVTFNSSGSSSDVINYSWDFGDGVKSMDENPTHQYNNSSNTFYACLTVGNGSSCNSTYCQYIDLVNSGIVNLQGPVFVCPNPVAGKQLTVMINDASITLNAKINVTDVLGRSLINTIPAGTQTLINVGDLAAGTYFLSLQSGNDVVVRKFVKQ